MHPTPPTLQSKSTSGLAIASLVTGLTCLWPAAIICGHIALSNIKKSEGQVGGRGMAIAGLILGYLGLALLILWSVSVVMIGGAAWKRGAERAQCIMQQRAIEQQLVSYCGEKGLKPGDTVNLAEALPAGTPSTCPSGIALSISTVVPEEGQSFVLCPLEDENGTSHAIVEDWQFDPEADSEEIGVGEN